jgi:ABC-2 type transport system permease protein
MHVSTLRLAEAVLSAVLVGLVFGTLALAVGSATGSRGIAVGVATATGMAAYSVNALSALVPALEVPARFSPFYHYSAGQPIRNGLDAAHVAVLVSLILTLAAIGVVTFQRRDVAV